MIFSFFTKSLQKQPLLIHGTSARFFKNNEGQKKPLCPSAKDSSDLFREHQIHFLKSLGIKNQVIFYTSQVHGSDVYVLRDSKISAIEVNEQQADAIVTHLPDCPLMVFTADCVPIIIYDPVKNLTGVVHAGRVGTQKRVFLNTVDVLSQEYGAKPQDLIIGMGPAIRGCCYKVSKHCIIPFINRRSISADCVKKIDQENYFLDLPEVNRLEGLEAGILEKNIYIGGPCTSCDNHRWYSCRKEGETGRLMTLAMIRSKK